MRVPTPRMVADAAEAKRLYSQAELEACARDWQDSPKGKRFLALLNKAKVIPPGHK